MTISDLEKRTREIGQSVFEQSARFFSRTFRKGYFSDKMMELSMQNPAFKVEAFRFVDVLPTLVKPDQINRHLQEYFLESGTPVPFLIKSSLGIVTHLPGTEKLIASLVKKNVTFMANGFITGQDSKTAVNNLKSIWNRGICFTVDILGEAAVAETEAKDYQARYIELIQGLSQEVKSWKSNPILEDTPWGRLPRANVSVKCTSLYSQIDPLAYRYTIEKIKERLRPIFREAIKCGAMVNLDMEQNDYRELFLSVAEEIFMEDEFREYPHFGIVIQAYLKCALNDLDRVIAYCKKRGTPLTVRLVKGAYWDYEVILATQRGWEIPVFTDKAATDENYEKCTDKLLGAYPHVISAFASHNIRSLSHAIAKVEELKIPKNGFEIQMLYGMADAFKNTFVKQGYRLREYAPVGEMLPGMAYLVRRLLENTSNESFLKVKYMKVKEAVQSLTPPQPKNEKVSFLKPVTTGEDTVNQNAFVNEPLIDFTKEENRSWIEPQLQKWREKLPLSVNPHVNGKEMEGTPVAQKENPSDRKEVVTRFTMANQYHADEALKACEKAKQTWGKWEPEKRAEAIRKVADIFKRRRREIITFMTLETGKTLKEADADIAEAIDFCRYYADEVVRLYHERELAGLPGESNVYTYRPRGTAVAIAPWNFPLAILTGTSIGPLVCGNPTIIKPAEQSTGVALFLYEALLEADVPVEAVHLLPGAGEVLGEYLVNHSQTHIITFTGSKAVGLQILRNAYQPLPGQKHIKKVVAELGGKNGVIIDDDADLDEAVQGAIYSAFAFQGQKCSALSRIFVLEPCYERFKQRFSEAMMSLKVSTADDLSAKVGPVIDEDSQKRLFEVINNHRDKIVAQLPLPDGFKEKGFFVPPTIFEDSDHKSELGQREFFGPLVTLFKVKTFEEAIQKMNDVNYALTGGVYSRSPAHIEKAREELEVGNLYINRGITGAIVNRQPFGGYKLSGCGGKAGGPDYLRNFLEPRAITENTMRRGFAPEI